MSGEKKFWDYLRFKLRPYGHFERIESHETAIGTPDVDYCIKGYNNKLELKYTEKENGCILRPAQAAWFKKRVAAGGQPWLLLQTNISKTRGYALIPGVNVPNLVHTKNVEDWLAAGRAVWADTLNIEELVEFLSTFVVPDSKERSSGLILPPGH